MRHFSAGTARPWPLRYRWVRNSNPTSVAADAKRRDHPAGRPAALEIPLRDLLAAMLYPSEAAAQICLTNTGGRLMQAVAKGPGSATRIPPMAV